MSDSEQKILLASTLTTGAIFAQTLFNYYKQKQEENKEEVKTEVTGSLIDSAFGESRTLYRTEAFVRSSCISNLSYKLALSLIRGGENFHGQVIINFDLSYLGHKLSIDYKGKEIRYIQINGHNVKDAKTFRDHKIYLPQELLNAGHNTIKIRFVSAYVRDCQGIHYYKDADGEEYLYSQFEAADAHMCFPCFDQPDLKAPYELLVFAPKDWNVVSNTKQITVSKRGENDFLKSMLKYEVADEMYSYFGDEEIQSHDFEESPKISPYLYAIMAGPYVCFNDQSISDIPQRIFCRKSVANFMENMKDEWFDVAIKGIRWYEKFFSTPWPFGKLDHIFVADYNMGAMENVGCVLYTDNYIQREEVFTEIKKQNIMVTLLHEISHMWFGDLVTMKWWDDLWLNESFANFISYLCLDEAEGLEKYNLAWSIFLGENWWGMKEDQQETTHPISLLCVHTEQAQDLFDGISYGKGAAFLKQLFFYFGRDVLKAGLKSYFKKYAFKNTELQDFLMELGKAAQQLGLKENLVEWSNSWLKTSGLNVISYHSNDFKGTIKSFTIQQGIFKYGNNILRKQKFQIALLDNDMNVYDIVVGHTDDQDDKTMVVDLVGKPTPYAYFINYNCHGYAKFKIDVRSLEAFEEKLSDLKDSTNRNLVYNLLFDMVKDGDLSGARFLNILKKHLPLETSEDVISDNLQWNIPAIIKSYIPLDRYDHEYASLFEMVVQGFLAQGKFADSNSTRHLLLETAINYARNDHHIDYIREWFVTNKVTDLNGNEIQNAEISKKHKHLMIRRIFSSGLIDIEVKEDLLKQLGEQDTSDWMDKTRYYCKAAIPTIENKVLMWNTYFGNEIDWQYSNYAMSFSGFYQVQHRHLLEGFRQRFFDQIEEVFKSKGRFIAESYYMYLQPSIWADHLTIGMFENLLKKVQAKSPDNTHFIKEIKSSLHDLRTAQRCKQLSEEYYKEIHQ